MIISNELVKVIIGSNANDALINYHNNSTTAILANILGVRSLTTHAVVDEEVKGEKLYLNDFPVDPNSVTLKDNLGTAITGYTFELDNYLTGRADQLSVINSAGLETFLPYDEVYASYTAGFTVQDTLKITAYATLVGATLSLTNQATGVTSAFTIVSTTPGAKQIQAITSNNVTAINIANAINGTASTDTVTVPLDYTLTITGSGATLTSANLPTPFKTCLAMMIKATLESANQVGNVASYSIGGKSVTYKDSNSMYNDIVSFYLPNYLNVKVIC